MNDRSQFTDRVSLRNFNGKFVAAMVMFAAFLVCSTVTTTALAEQPDEVLLIRGVGGHWPRMKEMRSKLWNQGFDSRAIWAIETAAEIKRIRRDAQTGRGKPPVAIVGFSLGATNAQEMAAELGKAGIRIPLLILVDGPTKPDAPDNVMACIHYHRPNAIESILSPAIAGHRLLIVNRKLIHARRGYLIRSKNGCTCVENQRLNRDGGLAALFDTHFTLPGKESLQRSVTADISDLLGCHR